MKRLTDLEYLQKNKFQKMLYKTKCFFAAIPQKFLNLIKNIGRFFAKLGIGIKNDVIDIYQTFKNGDYKTRMSFIIMGFGSFARKQYLRGVLFLLFELVFIVYMIFGGAHWLSLLPSLGKVPPQINVYSEELDTYTNIPAPDPSFKILLYGVLTILFMGALIYTWRLNVKQNKINEEIIKLGKKINTNKDDLRSALDEQFHKTLLALPTIGVVIFTVLPILFMILIAFTNFDAQHDGRNNNLFTWIG